MQANVHRRYKNTPSRLWGRRTTDRRAIVHQICFLDRPSSIVWLYINICISIRMDYKFNNNGHALELRRPYE